MVLQALLSAAVGHLHLYPGAVMEVSYWLVTYTARAWMVISFCLVNVAYLNQFWCKIMTTIIYVCLRLTLGRCMFDSATL